MIRVTTNGVLTGYKSSLMRSRNQLESTRNQVLTQRNFNSFAENPAAATHAFQLRRSAWATDMQLTTSDSVTKKFEAAFGIIMSTHDDLAVVADGTVLTGLSDTSGAGRSALGKTLNGMADSIVHSLNTKYGAGFIFNGANGDEVPFSWSKGDPKELLFNGLNVNDPANEAALKAMTEQSTFADIGLGMQEDAQGNIIPATAFDSALSGLDFLGYGSDEKGLPNNLVSVIKELGDILSRCKEDSNPPAEGVDGNWGREGDQEKASALALKLKEAMSTLRTAHSEMDTRTTFLNTNHTRLKDSFSTVNEQILGVEQMDLADAINNFSWAQYCYNAALKVGNTILSESLIDYMR